MHVVVTGASGNVGTALLRALSAQRPDWAVTGIARRVPDPQPPYDAATWRSLDLSEAGATAGLAETARGADALVHLAWVIQPSHDLELMQQVNVEGTRRVADAVRAAGVAHLVVASSLGAYSPAPDKPRVAEDWPTEGVPTSPYSRQKVAIERLLDAYEAEGPAPVVTRLRPGLVLQAAAASEQARYFLGSALPVALAGRIPLVPLPRPVLAPAIHAEDLADAIVRILDRRAAGPFNLAADDPVTRRTLAAALGGRPVAVPNAVLRTLVDTTWRAHLQPVDVGWFDMGLGVPLLDTARAKGDLGWAPRWRVDEVLRDAVTGLRRGSGTASPALHPRSLVRDLLPSRIRQHF